MPDGFFLDFSDPPDPQFYIVEVELSERSFFNHVFPQITKFFAFFKNTKLQKSLVDIIFSIVDADAALKGEFKECLGQLEICKFLSDVIESSQNILLVADGQIAELPEIIDTYTDTWGKMVRYLEIKKYCANTDIIIYTIRPDFETLQYEGGEVIEKAEDEVEPTNYGEAYRLEGVSTIVKEIYNQIKAIAGRLDNSLVFNPQKYYISIKAGKNIAFLKIRVKKVRFIAMLPEDGIRKSINHHSVATLSAPVEEFYSGPCAAVDIKDSTHMDEIEILMHRMMEYNKSNNG